MRILVLGGTGFIGRRVVECLDERGDDVAVSHRGVTEPYQWVSVQHIHADRRELSARQSEIRAFAPEAIVDSNALTGADVDAVTVFLPDVPVVVLSSQDVYQAIAALRAGRCDVRFLWTRIPSCAAIDIPIEGKGMTGCPTTMKSSMWKSDGCGVEPSCFACRWSMGPMTTNYARVRS